MASNSHFMQDACVDPTHPSTSNVEIQTAAPVQKIESVPQLEASSTDLKIGSIATQDKRSAKKYPSILKRYKKQRLIQIKRMLNSHVQKRLDNRSRFSDDDEIDTSENKNDATTEANKPVQINVREKTNDQTTSNMVQFANSDIRLKNCNKPVQLWVQLPGQDKLTLIVTQSLTDKSANTSVASIQDDGPKVASSMLPKNNSVKRSNTLYLAGIPRNTDNHQKTLQDHFEWCEGFNCARVPRNDSGQAKGYAFIHFSTATQAETAMKQRCNATLSINGKVLRATFSSMALR